MQCYESMNQCYTLYVMNVYCDQIMSHDLLWTFLALKSGTKLLLEAAVSFMM